MRIFFVIILLVIILYGILHLSVVQTWLVKKVAGNLSEKLHTKVTVKKVDFRFFNKILLEGVMAEDQKKDTLLYAGVIKAEVNDWFFFKDNISIQNVEVSNALVNMNRTDSVWNYQFLVDYSASPKKSTSKKDDVAVDLKELHLVNVYFNKKDGWIGQDMIANLGRFDMIMDQVDLKHKKISIKSINIERPYFSQNDYEGKRPPTQNLQQVIEKIPVLGAFKWNDSGWEIKLNKLEMKDGAFQNDKQTDYTHYTDRFDGKHILFSSISGTMNNLLFVRDTLSVNVSLSAKEKSGLLIKKLYADMKLTPELMEFNHLDLITNCSRLRDYYAMKYEDFSDDFSSFMHNVKLSATFKESYICSDDLAFFAPVLKSWKRVINIEGTAAGTLDNFSAKNMKLKSGNTILEGNIAMRGLPDINSTFIDFESKKFNTTYADMINIIPQLRNIKQPSIYKLGAVAFTGNFTGFIRDFVAYGTFNTALGNITADVNMKTPKNRSPAYSGSLSTTGFNIGSFIGNRELGRVALNVKISGAGFNVNELKAKVDGRVNAVEFGGYNYRNLVINGDFDKKLFMGHLSIDDPNLKITSLDGALNLSDKNLGFKLQADVQKANLKNLGFSKEELGFAGYLDLNFTGNNIDNFLGTANISRASFTKPADTLSLDSVTVRSEIINGKKSLTLHSAEVDANITGDFRIQELPDAVTVLLAKYYPAYIKAPSYIVKSTQDFAFTVNTSNADRYLSFFTKKLSGFNNSSVSGSFNLKNYDLHLNAAVPQFTYEGKVFNNVLLKGTGTKDTLIADIAVEDIIVNDSLHFPDSKLRVTAANDVSLIRLNSSASKIFGDAELNATVTTLKDGVKIHFYPSSFMINNNKWQLDKDGELTLRKRFLDASTVRFFHDDREIVLSTELSDDGSGTHVVANLKNINLADFAFILPKKPGLQGIITGTATAKDIFGKTTIEFKGRADSFALDNRYMGKVNLEANANTETGDITYKADTDEKDFKFTLDGKLNYKDTTGNSFESNLVADKLNIDILQPYLSTIFSEMKGMANGKIRLISKNKDLTLSGDAIISGGRFKVAYTQVAYTFDNQPIHFGKDLIDIGTLYVKDTLGNTGTVSGKMYHKFFQDFSFENLKFSSQKIMLLNTTKKDNQDFYGNVIGKATMTLNGDVANMKMNIVGEPSATDSSHIYLPTGSSRESNVIDYIEFIQFGSLMDNVSSKDVANLTVDMDLTANPACKIDVILDAETGDIIKGQGNGHLQIKAGTKEPLDIRGQYNLTEGQYTFDFQTFVKKPFVLNEGSITWNGDPLLANLDIKAEYVAKNVDISILSPTGTSTGTARQQEDITIVSHLTGTLKKIKTEFELKLQDKSPLSSDFYVVKKLAEIRNDENEMNKQVASLILFSQFINPNQSFITGGNTLSIATSTIGGVVSAWLTSVLSKALEKATKGKLTPYLDLNPSLNQSATQLQANIRGGLRYRFSENLQLLVGGNLDYNNPVAQLYSKGAITPDISLEWLLNKDGSLRVIAFNRTTIDFTTGQRNRSGVQIGYSKDVDRLGDIFRSRKKIAQLDSLKLLKPPVRKG